MRRLLLGAFSMLLICELLCSCPVAAFVGLEPGVNPAGYAPLDSSQQRLAVALRFVDSEREYFAKKTIYQQALADRSAGQTWYDPGFVECALCVPLFGIILPFFGMIFFGTVRSLWRTSSARANE